MLKKLSLAFGMILFAATAVSAQAVATPKASKRQQAQTSRIAQGVQSGELTRRETADLARQQRNIKRSKRQAKADGKVTRRERARLQTQQNAANRNIKRKKHNRRDRG